MTRTLLNEERLRNLIKMGESPAERLIRQLENSPAAQAARMLERHDVTRFMTSVEQARVAFELYSKSSRWAECSASIELARRAVESSEALAALRSIDRNLRKVVLEADRVALPAAETLQALTQSAAHAIQPLHEHFVEVERWHSSVARRMAALTVPWAMKDHLGVSIVGFSRIARLHDVSTGAAPFAPQTAAVFEEELGKPVPFDADEVPEDRESAAMDAGFNPELIAFPEPVYPSVLFSAGFELRIEAIGSVQSEKGDDSGVFEPQHASLLQQVEHRLRKVVETELRELVGNNWYRSRVPGSTWQRWRDRKEEDDRQRGDSFPLIFYADFTDLSDIICRRDNWNDVFHRLFVSKDDIRVSLQRLSPIRKAIAHNRPLVRTDQLILLSEACRILGALGVRLWTGGHIHPSHVASSPVRAEVVRGA